MNVPKSKIEENAVHEIEGIARLHNALSPEIASNDKVMSYDGFIWLYSSSEQHSKKTFDDKIPVQVKGHIDDKEEFLNKRRITYVVEVDDLRVYSEKEGVVYFQVFMKSLNDCHGSWKTNGGHFCVLCIFQLQLQLRRW